MAVMHNYPWGMAKCLENFFLIDVVNAFVVLQIACRISYHNKNMLPIAVLRRHRSVKTILDQTLEPTWASEPEFFNHTYLIDNTAQEKNKAQKHISD